MEVPWAPRSEDRRPTLRTRELSKDLTDTVLGWSPLKRICPTLGTVNIEHSLGNLDTRERVS